MLTSRLLRSFLLAVFALPACSGSSEPTTTSRHEAAPSLVAPAPVATVVDVPAPAVAIAKPVVTAPAPVARELPTKYDDALDEGKRLAAQGDGVGARELFEAAAKLDRKAAAPHVELARLFIASGDRGLAMAAANKAVKLAPASSQAWNTLGRAELARFGYDGAIAAFTKATELDTDNVWAWNNLGFTQLAQKHYAEAVEALARATNCAGATGYMWNNLGTAYEQLGQLDEARAAFAAGGKLGSGPALASAKRLVGVTAIVAVRPSAPVVKSGSEPGVAGVHEYETREPEPEPDIAPPDAKIEIEPTTATPADAGVDDAAVAPQTL